MEISLQGNWNESPGAWNQSPRELKIYFPGLKINLPGSLESILPGALDQYIQELEINLPTIMKKDLLGILKLISLGAWNLSPWELMGAWNQSPNELETIIVIIRQEDFILHRSESKGWNKQRENPPKKIK